MNDFTPLWFVNKKTKEIEYQDSCGDFMIPTKEQLVDILNNNEKLITNYLLMVEHQEQLIKKLQKELNKNEDDKMELEKSETICNILKFPPQTNEE